MLEHQSRLLEKTSGVCPECGEPGQWRNVGKERWGYCARHGLKWYVENVETFINSAQDEGEDDWVQNDAFLTPFRRITRDHKGPTLFERIVGRLRKWRRRIVKGLILEARINVIGADEVCHVCECGNKHPPGLTETYIAGTERWVCLNCAFGIDSELANYVGRLLLEARVDLMSGYYACHTCGTGQGHTAGATQTYLEGTELWVCRDCAFRIDSQLARFAYEPGSSSKRKQRFREKNDHWGLCPECGEYPTGWKNIGRTHWVCCERHGLKWCVGENLFSSWRDENEDDWERNALFLRRLRQTDPYVRGIPLLERIGYTLIRSSGSGFRGCSRQLWTAALREFGFDQGCTKASDERDHPF